MKETREFGEKRIMELMSKLSEYGELERALFRPRTPERGLVNRDPSMQKGEKGTDALSRDMRAMLSKDLMEQISVG